MEYRTLKGNPKECEREMNDLAADGWRVRTFDAFPGGGQAITCVALLERSTLRASAEETAGPAPLLPRPGEAPPIGPNTQAA